MCLLATPAFAQSPEEPTTESPQTGPPQIRYISDELTVPLRSGPSNSHRILHRGLPSGTRLTLLETDEDGGFAHIVTERGADGWVPTQYLVDTPIARDRLAAMQTEVSRMRERLANARSELEALAQTNRETSATTSDQQARIEALQTELEEVKRVSAGALQLNSDNKRLTELNTRLRDELDDLLEVHRRLESNLQRQWMLIGGGLMLAGLLIGTVIKARPRRSGWS